jgi:hypothetical protein
MFHSHQWQSYPIDNRKPAAFPSAVSGFTGFLNPKQDMSPPSRSLTAPAALTLHQMFELLQR